MPSPTPSLMLLHTLLLEEAGLIPQKELKKHHFKLCTLAAAGPSISYFLGAHKATPEGTAQFLLLCASPLTSSVAT